MTQSQSVDRYDTFSLWYRFRAVAVFNLLHLGGPAHLQQHNDPRDVVEQEYLRRRALHRERKGKAPLPVKPKSADTGQPTLVLPMLVGVALVIVLIAFVVGAAR
jgi:hypothetical protein